MIVKIKVNLTKEQINNLDQLHGEAISYFKEATYLEDGRYSISAETSLSEDELKSSLKDFIPQRKRVDVLMDKIKNNEATLEERFKVYDILLGIEKRGG